VQAVEVDFDVTLTVDPDASADLREKLVERLEAAHYPVGDVEVIERADWVEIVARLTSTAVNPGELDDVVAALEHIPGVRHATWDSRTRDRD
jgi:putative Mg2+ transporter-C (MgtC) family protein